METTRRPTSFAKVAGLVGVELLLFAVVAGSFWYQDLRYSLPAPRPRNWKAPPIGAAVSLPAPFALQPDRRPLAFNFYNCDCPCSRFNLEHVQRLLNSYGSRVRFVMVIEGGSRSEEEAVFRDLDLDTEYYCDTDGSLARRLGVYATPQAAVFDSYLRLVYRGNYNVGRYCVDPRTEFVRFALASVVTGTPLPAQVRPPGAEYGCAIPAQWTQESELK